MTLNETLVFSLHTCSLAMKNIDEYAPRNTQTRAQALVWEFVLFMNTSHITQHCARALYGVLRLVLGGYVHFT